MDKIIGLYQSCYWMCVSFLDCDSVVAVGGEFVGDWTRVWWCGDMSV